MKKIIYPVVLFALLIGAQSFKKDANQDQPKRVAMIVAIADYQPQARPSEQWGHLSSMHDDTIITEALKKQGFDNIIHISNEKATIAGIRKGFADLTKIVKPGDVVYIHFSSHGQQIWDNNGDEMDGLDECVVCYDSPMHYKAGYKGEKHLRDDELGKLVNEVRLAAGPDGDVMVISDACHSGTALRGPVCRGTEPPMVPPDFDPAKVSRTKDSSLDNFVANPEKMSPWVLYSACRAQETNQEYKGFGSLSFALAKVLNEIHNGDTYRSLFASVNNEMAHMDLGQVPMIEGSVDRKLFAGSKVKQSDYYSVNFVKTGQLVVVGGTLSGLYVGSKVAVMPAGSTGYDASKVIYNGTISSANSVRAYIETDKDLSDFAPSQLWVFVTEQAFGSYKLKIAAGEGLNGKIKNDIKSNIMKLEFVEWADKNADLYINSKNNKYYITLPDDRKPFTDCDDYQTLNVQISNFMQGKLMSEAVFSDPDMKVELSFVPHHLDGFDENTNPIISDVPMASKFLNGSWELIDDDVMTMTLTNSGKKDAYVNILEIDPTGKVTVVLPDYENNESPTDFKLIAGKSIEVSEFVRRFNGPQYGKYIYKVFATDVPVSFRSIYNTRGSGGTETYVHPAAKLFGQSYQTTRGDNLKVSKTSGGGTTTEYVLRLNPKK